MTASIPEKKFISVNERKTGYQTQKVHLTYKEIYKRALKYLQKGDTAASEKDLNFLLNEQPEDPQVLYYLSAIELQKKHNSHAMILMEKAMDLHNNGKPLPGPEYKSLINNFGYIWTNRQDKKRAEEYFQQALKINPADADVLSNIGSLYINEGNPNKGLHYLKKCLKIKPDHPHAQWNASLCFLENGQFGKGFDLYEAGFRTGDRVERSYYGEGQPPFWDGTPDKTKTVAIYGEQGIGDEIMFASILPEVARDINVVFECHPRLTNIFRNSFDFPVFGTRKAKGVTWTHLVKPDYKLSIASLGKFYRRTVDDFPSLYGYLKPDEQLKQYYKEKLQELGDKPKIGISWEGGIAKTASDYRSIPLDQWKDIFDVDADFISLQYTPDAHLEAEKFGLHHWQDAIDDYDHTTALVSNLDLVISVCTSVIHLSGALNVPCWVLTPNKPAWRYGIKGRMYWYNSVKLYRQHKEWPFKQIRSDLCSFLKNTNASMPNCTSPTTSTAQVECGG